MEHLYILGTIIFTVCGQLILKWRIAQYGVLPVELKPKVFFLLNTLLDPFIVISLASAFIASLFWMAAMTKFEISYAYPFIGCTYILNLIFAVWLLHEPLTGYKVIGNLFILLGIIIASRTV